VLATLLVVAVVIIGLMATGVIQIGDSSPTPAISGGE